MNIERMLEVADLIERDGLRDRGVTFNMSVWLFHRPHGSHVFYIHDQYDCGTVGCVAGYACIAYGEVGSPVEPVQASAYLGLDDEQAHRLFHNGSFYVSPAAYLTEITKEEAVAAIRRMVAEEMAALVLVDLAVQPVREEELVCA